MKTIQTLLFIGMGVFVGAVAMADVPYGRFVDIKPVTAIEPGTWRDCCSAISPDNLSIVFTSLNRVPRLGGWDIFRLTRETTDVPFGNLENVRSLNSVFGEAVTSFSSDGETVILYSDRPGGLGSNDIYTAKVSDTGFTEVTNLTAVNSSSTEWSPAMSPDGRELIFVSDRPGTQGSRDLWGATRENTSDAFGNVTRMANLSSDGFDEGPSFSADGRHLFLGSDRGEGGLFVASRATTTEPFGTPVNLNDFSLGSLVNLPGVTELYPSISPDWPAPGSKLYFTHIDNPDGLGVFEIPDWDIYEATWVPEPPTLGDFSGNGVLDAPDIDDLTGQSASGTNNVTYDLTGDGLVDGDDVAFWISDATVFNSWVGDLNLDLEFNSTDLTLMLGSGTYEKGTPSVWSQGDFNGDGVTDSADLSAGLANGGYEKGPRTATAAVPEPSTVVLLCVGLLMIVRRIR